MKSLRRVVSIALLLGAAALTFGAAPAPMERVKRELRPDGELYLVFSPDTLQRHISELCISLERGVAESSMPNRDALQSVLTLLRIFDRLAGFRDIAALGASSVREASGFSNRAAVVARKGSTGWLWRVQGEAAPRLGRIGELPADTVLALDFGIDLRPAIDDLRKAGLGKTLERNYDWLLFRKPREMMETVSGEWRIAVALPDGRKLGTGGDFIAELMNCDIFVSVPDNREVLAQVLELLAATTPSTRRIGNVIYIPDGGGGTMVFVKLERRLVYFSSVRSFDKFLDGSANVGANGKFVPGKPKSKTADRRTLSGSPEFAAAVEKLPAVSRGAYFMNGAMFGNILELGGKNGFRMTLPPTADRAVGVWLADDGMIAVRELASESLSIKFFDALVETPLALLAEHLLREPEKPSPASPKGGKPETVKKTAPAAKVKPAPDAAKCAECRARLQKIRSSITDYAQHHNGEFPPSLPEIPACGAAKYVYFGPFAEPPSGKIPLVVDPVKGGAHPGTVNVLFVDGSIESFDFDAGSLKRLCSFLHTVYKYNEKEFIRLIKKASRLDAAKGE